MKKISRTKPKRDTLPEYDFRNGVRGKYARRFAAGTNLVLLEPDVARVFRDGASVNETLRSLLRLGQRERRKASG